MKLLLALALPALLITLSFISGEARAAEERFTLPFDGQERVFYIETPQAKRLLLEKLPVVMVLHGGGGRGKDGVAGQAQLASYVDGDWPFIAVYPESLDQQWNDGRAETSGFANDVGFLQMLARALVKKWNADPDKIFVAGISNGGMITQRLMCDAAETFAAGVSISAGMPADYVSKCHPSRPVSITLMHGTADPLMPWAGGEITSSKSKGVGGTVLSAEDTFAFWVKNAGCGARDIAKALPDTNPSDGTTVIVHHYGPCAENTNVNLYEIAGGGHTWPGGTQAKGLRKRISGVTSQDINATQIMLKVFQRAR